MKKIKDYFKIKKPVVLTSIQFDYDLMNDLRDKLKKENITLRQWAEASARKFLNEK